MYVCYAISVSWHIETWQPCCLHWFSAAKHPFITLQLLSTSVKSGEENQHTNPTLPIPSNLLISLLLGCSVFFPFLLSPLSLSPFSNMWKGSMPLYDGTTGLEVLSKTLEESTNCSQQNLGTLFCTRIQFEFECKSQAGAESVRYTNDCQWQ